MEKQSIAAKKKKEKADSLQFGKVTILQNNEQRTQYTPTIKLLKRDPAEVRGIFFCVGYHTDAILDTNRLCFLTKWACATLYNSEVQLNKLLNPGYFTLRPTHVHQMPMWILNSVINSDMTM